MSETLLEAIERLERLAAWHRINAERAGADWVWEARVRAAEDLERQAAKIRGQFSSGDSVQIEVAAFPAPGREASDGIANLKRCISEPSGKGLSASCCEGGSCSPDAARRRKPPAADRSAHSCKGEGT